MKDTALRWLYAVPGRKKLYVVVLTVLQAVYGGSSVLYALFLRSAVDAATEGDSEGFWRSIAFTAALIAAQLGLRALIRWLNELARSEFENLFKKRLFDTLLSKEHLHVSAVHSGQWLNRLTNDTVYVANCYAEIVPGLAGTVVRLVSALVMLIVLEPRFAMILIPAGACLIFLTWLFRRVMKRLHKEVQEADGRVRIFLQERLSSLLMIRSFAARPQTEAEADEYFHAHRKVRMRRTHFSNLCNIGFSAALSGMYLVGIAWCGWGILTGTISFGTMTAVTQLIGQVQSPFANITGYLPRYYAMLASAERLMEAEAFPDDGGPGLEADEIHRFYDETLASFGFSDVDFAYYPAGEEVRERSKEGMPAVLSGLSLSIRKGEYVAFTGRSGCGKSTALKLLMCVYQPDAGERWYEDAQGERRPLDGAYRRLFAYVPQGNLLMHGTIRDAVAFARPGLAHDEERLSRALRIACADEFVETADAELGERGMSLSEGQMQRIAIARAIFSDAPVLLLDEATSALDEKTERQLLVNLRSLTDKTVVIVTHRRACLSVCDREIRFPDREAQA